MRHFATDCTTLRLAGSVRGGRATRVCAQTRHIHRLPQTTSQADSGRRTLTVERTHMAANAATNDEAPVTRSGTTTSHRILRLPQVCAMTGLGRSMIYQMEAEERFPRRVNIGVRAV